MNYIKCKMVMLLIMAVKGSKKTLKEKIMGVWTLELHVNEIISNYI